MLVFAAEGIVVQGSWLEIAAGVITMVITLLGGLIGNAIRKAGKKAKLSEANTEALESLLEGMAKIQETTARGLKAAAADGKLTKDEVSQLQSAAWEHAKVTAKGPAKEVVINWSKDRVASLIKQLLAKYKGKK